MTSDPRIYIYKYIFATLPPSFRATPIVELPVRSEVRKMASARNNRPDYRADNIVSLYVDGIRDAGDPPS